MDLGKIRQNQRTVSRQTTNRGKALKFEKPTEQK
jgi:hypothetical protein